MYLSYLDSSGRPEYSDPENFVLASVTVNEHQWYHMKKEIEQIKLKYFPSIDPEKIEFHAKDMINHSGAYKGLSWNTIYSMLDDFFDFMTRDTTHISIIAAVINKEKLRKKIDLEVWGHRFVFERLNEYLAHQNHLLAESGNPHEYGIMIMDSEGSTKDQKLRNKLTSMLNHGTKYSELGYLIEDPLFTDSKWRNLSQVVDCIAYCIRKKHRKNNTNNMHLTYWEKYYSMIEKKFHSKNGYYLKYGLKIFP